MEHVKGGAQDMKFENLCLITNSSKLFWQCHRHRADIYNPLFFIKFIIRHPVIRDYFSHLFLR
jgi:hypothetical protein